MNEYQIKDVNGIEDLTIRLDGPGVYVARGPNGSGKTSAVEALKAASGDATAKAEPSDGVAKGEVRGFGKGEVIMAIGNRRRLNGAPMVRLISTGAIGQLIDPGIKDSALAARARLRALLTLMPLPADDAARKELTRNDEELQRWIAGDPSTDAMDLAEALRHRANDLACELEKRSAEAIGEQNSFHNLLLVMGDLDFEAGDFAEAKVAADRLAAEATVKTHTAKARAMLEEQQGKIRLSIGERPDEKPLIQQIEDYRDEVAKLEAKIERAKSSWHAVRIEYQRTHDAALLWDQQAEILRRTPEGPTFNEALEATLRAEEAVLRADRAMKLSTAKGYQARANTAKELAAKCADRAKTLRSVAQGTADALGRLLERRGLPGLVIAEGRLAVKEGEHLKDFELRLSFGERVSAALMIALAGVSHEEDREGKLPLLPLEPGFWLALDAAHQAEVCAVAKARGVCLITEEPDAGKLRIEQMA